MKEATGELNMTVVTVVAIAAVGAFFYAFVWPGIKSSLANNTCKNMCPAAVGTQSAAKANKDENGDFTSCTCPDGNNVDM